ncbi:protein PIN-LIKES 1-like isoform X2 [Pyrus x bretschneideri]|uniref:protein PIN-LIKES 1-like isoform X2 n=1 Tax=Pyrus x bretschneideri TaxID=225117 RepID=UPI00202FFEAC|nr:protein PIN-LIKES 1-like isoform X2 [Pyrus x bretschneideri]
MELKQLLVTALIPVLKVLSITALGSYLALDRVNILGEVTRKNLNTVVFYVFGPALVSSNVAQTSTYQNMVKMWFIPVNILITFIIGSILGCLLIQLIRPPAHLRGLVLGCCAAVPEVCKEKGSPFGAPDVCHMYAMGYASLSMAVGDFYVWSYVYNIVRISSRRGNQDYNQSVERSSTSDQATTSRKLEQRIVMVLQKINLKSIFAPSTIGALVGFPIGVIPQIRKLFLGDGAPLRVIQDTAYLLGDGAIPSLILIIGGNLLKGLRGSGIQKSLVVGIIVVRYVALPLIGILVVKGALKFGLVHSDPLYLFVLLLQFSLPPAMNIGIMTQVFGAGENECSVIMLWTYAFASLSLTFWSAAFMWLVARL